MRRYPKRLPHGQANDDTILAGSADAFWAQHAHKLQEHGHVSKFGAPFGKQYAVELEDQALTRRLR